MENSKVSVVIPVYNGEKTLRHCLTSILRQTYKNYEVIVVDNNSTDKTKEIIKEFQGKNIKIIYIFEPLRGIGSAKNAGIKKAKGEIIAITDADCIVPENWIQELIKPIIYENELVVRGSQEDLIKNYWTKNYQKANSEFLKLHIKDKYISDLDTKNFAIKTSIAKKLMFDPEIKAMSDFEFYLRFKKIGKLRFKPLVRVGHYHPSSFKKFVKNSFRRGYSIKKIFDKHKRDTDLKKEPMFESLSIKNFLLFPFWLILQFIKKPLGEAYFILVSEISWRAGILWAILF